ncbi:hypothetical protein MPF_1026 [Methanohalophilus portucalensis FDF-1]|nr:cobaltochelatase subunit CobN [Methanohalophilus portucalensis]OJH49159.1 hypothetical protein MPF_1026 [Methanohalophilus portucalensis FDF-1]
MLAVAVPAVSAEEQVNVTLITYNDGEVINYAKDANPYNDSINVTYHSTMFNLSEIDLSNQDVIFTYMLWSSKYEEFSDELEKAKSNGSILIDITSYVNTSIYDHTFTGSEPYQSKDEKYFFNMGMQEEFLKENTENFLVYLAKNYSTKTGLTASWVYEDPILLPEGIYHPDSDEDVYWFDNSSEYITWYQNSSNGDHFVYNYSKPTIGIWFHKEDYKAGNMEIVDALISDLESKDCNVIAGFDTFLNISEYYCYENGTPLVDCMISLKSFGLDVSKYEGYGQEELTNLNVPVLKGMVADASSGDPADANRGISNQEATRKTVLPNIDGIFEYIVLGEQKQISWGVYEYEPNPDQIDWMVNRTIKWADLKRNENQDKKVALIYYNYPPGKDSIGASYLDSMSSIVNLLEKMNESEYNLTYVPENTTTLLDRVQKQGINVGSWAPGELDEMVENRTEWGVHLIPVETYREWFSEEIPEDLRNCVIEEWGEPWSEDFSEDQKLMIWENESGRYIVIPAVQCGNTWLMPQPARGMTQNDNVLYHSTLVPPPHQYIAFYLWLNDEWDADAVIHMGTHGTHEWLPGLAYGMNRTSDWAPLLLQDLPNIYPYIVANVGEGLTAEYRGNALIIDHLTPTLERGGLHAEMADLSGNIQTYYDPGMADDVRDEYRKIIIDQMVDLNLDEDLTINESTLENYRNNDPLFQAFVKNVLHEYLEEISEENIPYGFHVLGEVPPTNLTGPKNDQLSAMVRAMLGSRFQNNVSAAFYQNETVYPMGIPLNDTKIDRLVWEVITNNTDCVIAQDRVYSSNNSSITADLGRGIEYRDDLLDSDVELDKVISALGAGFISPGPGRDPIQNPDSVPTGRNFYGVDSRLYPSPATWELGSRLAQNMLEDYYDKHGEYPEKVSFSRFGVEFIRDHGTLEAEVLYLLGVKPVWDETSKQVIGLSLLNESELLPNYDPSKPGRPRIDIVYTTAGMRDAFPDKIKMIDEAVRLANEAPEGNYTNYVNQSTQEVRQALIDAGYDKETASKLSTMRCFAVRDGTYEIGVANAIGASGTWDDEAAIADLYLNKMGYSYGTDMWGFQSSDLLTEALRDVDASIHSDSSNLYDTLDNDDFFQYFGGMNLATRHISANTPEMYVSDTRNSAESGMVTMKEYLNKNLRSRYFNDKWIEGMKGSGYAGGKMFSEFVENLWGWEVSNPELVDDSDWETVYEQFVNDPEMEEWFKQNNPDAYQSITARMLETTRKDYWDPSDEMFQDLMRNYAESVVEDGVSCCHHTCGNPMLNSYVVEGLMSVPGVVSDETLSEFVKKIEQATQKRLETSSSEESQSPSSSGGVGSAQIVNASTTGTSSNQTTTTSDGGYGESTQEPTSESAESSSDYVEGYEMTKENPRKDNSGGSSFSGADIVGTILVLAAVGAMYIGFRRRQM